MKKEEKLKIIEDLKVRISDSKNLYLTDISGLNSLETSALRRACFKANIKLSVVKNTMLSRAMESSDKDFGEMKDILKGNTSLMFSEIANTPAKLIKDFRKKLDKPILKAAFIDEQIYIGDDEINKLVSMKSREEIIGEIIMILESPVKNVLSALKSGGANLSGLIKTLSER
ncbi:MAG: 50S ribosomal protein L10 [Flavobacteriaceae bacterium]|nr:50S ribosomal protein L10 [Flavobacteriaceae bacterium]|tara:strand:+ start:11881 stop:12396 length:516 start_codon:yes stop_codon:yes gene_type:complete